MELNEAIKVVTGAERGDEYRVAMKKLLPAYKDMKRMVEDGVFLRPNEGICYNMNVYSQSTRHDKSIANHYNVTKIMAYLWPQTYIKSFDYTKDFSYPIAGLREKRFQIWTVNKARRLEFLNFIIEQLEKIE